MFFHIPFIEYYIKFISFTRSVKMSFQQPLGRIKVNTKKGIYRRINPLNRDNYILLDEDAVHADSERTYILNGKTIVFNKHRDSIDRLSNLKF